MCTKAWHRLSGAELRISGERRGSRKPRGWKSRRSNETVHDRKRCPGRGREAEPASGTSTEPTDHNESEPHPMSIENETTGKPSPCPNGEGSQGRTRQPSETAHGSGGVSGDGMSGRATEVTREICLRGAQAPTSCPSLTKGEAGAARAEVGDPRSSDEASEMGVERRRGSCADAHEASGERGDGPRGLRTPMVRETATGVRKLPRTLYRQAKSKPPWKALKTKW